MYYAILFYEINDHGWKRFRITMWKKTFRAMHMLCCDLICIGVLSKDMNWCSVVKRNWKESKRLPKGNSMRSVTSNSDHAFTNQEQATSSHHRHISLWRSTLQLYWINIHKSSVNWQKRNKRIKNSYKWDTTWRRRMEGTQCPESVEHFSAEGFKSNVKGWLLMHLNMRNARHDFIIH